MDIRQAAAVFVNWIPLASEQAEMKWIAKCRRGILLHLLVLCVYQRERFCGLT